MATKYVAEKLIHILAKYRKGPPTMTEETTQAPRVDAATELVTDEDIVVNRKLFDKLLEKSFDLERAQTVAKIGSWRIHLEPNGTTRLDWSNETYRIFDMPIDARIDYVQFLNLIHPDDREKVDLAWKMALAGEPYKTEHRVNTHNGTIWVREQAELSFDQCGVCYYAVGTVQDITKSRMDEERLAHMAHYDPLTNLPNRTLLFDRLKQSLAMARRSNGLLAVCYLDLDGFKLVNDQYGHETGDALLIEVGVRISAIIRDTDTVARIGGDEFVVLLGGIRNVKECSRTVNRILSSIRTPFRQERKYQSVSASMGVTVYPCDSEDPDQLIRYADQAMYSAKDGGKNCFRFFDAEHHEQNRSKLEEIRKIRSALLAGQFCLHFQPKVSLLTGCVVGFEALSRWQTPDGMIGPGRFMPLIDEDPIVTEFGEWVIRKALEQMSSWQMNGVTYGVISVNISPAHLQDPNFARGVAQILSDFPEIPPDHLEIEVVETGAIQNLEQTAQTVAECRAMGISFALDDFGTGYSSLSYLKRLKAATLKIDQSFVRDMLENPDDLYIIQGTIGLAEAFGQLPIAEGVETMGQAELLFCLGCYIIQGFGIARPMAPENIKGWMVEYSANPVIFQKKGNAPFKKILEHSQILSVKSRHLDWMKRIKAQIAKQCVPIETDPTECRFAHWYVGPGLHTYGGEDWFKALGPLHERMHELALSLTRIMQKDETAQFRDTLVELDLVQSQFLLSLNSAFEKNVGI